MIWVDKIYGRDKTNHIKKATNTLFRQLHSLDISFSMVGKNWKGGKTDKDALVAFSKGQGISEEPLLVVIPKRIVDKYIFYPIFENFGNGYSFKPKYSHFNYIDNKINLILNKNSSIISLRYNSECKGLTIDLFYLPEGDYWFPIDLRSYSDPVGELVSKINETVKKVSDGKGIRVIEKL